jgi:FKBP-type peptidyl-prolyl cis-trans isomerase FkpA
MLKKIEDRSRAIPLVVLFTLSSIQMPLRFFQRGARRAVYRAVSASLFVGLATGCLGTTDPGPPSNPATETYAPSLGIDISQMTKLSPDLYIKDITVGTGTVVAAGSKIQVTYTGYFVDGTTFDSNVGGTPYPVTLGQGAVIDGWEQGIPGMKVGGKRRLVVGSALAYGSSGYYAIPPNTTLVFDVTIVSAQ